MAFDATISVRSVCGWTGRHAFRLFIYPVDLFLFIAYTLRDGVKHRRLFIATLHEVLHSGASPLPAILLLGFLVGFTFALPLIMFSPQLAETELAPLLMQLIGLELGSLLTAVVLIGRTGRTMAIELASTRPRTDESSFLAPQLIATSLVQLVLATYFVATALFGGMLLASQLYRGETTGLAVAILTAVEAGELLLFIAKNLLFGLIVAGAAGLSAYRIDATPAKVAARSQEAATGSLLLVFFIDGLLAIVAT